MSEDWRYGVAHVEGGEIIEVVEHDSLEDARRDAATCDPDSTGAVCHAVRRPTTPDWQPLP